MGRQAVPRSTRRRARAEAIWASVGAKRYARSVRVFRVIVAFGVLSACTDEGLTGKWHGEFTTTPDGEISLVIEEDSDRLFGSATYEDQSGETLSMVEGRVEDARIELDFVELDNAHYEAHAQGENMMTGTWFRRGMSEMLTLKRLVSEE